MDGKLLLRRKSHKYDDMRFSILIFLVFVIIYVVVESVSPHKWILLKSFLEYGFTGDGVWLVILWVIVIGIFILFYTIEKFTQLDKDEFLYLKGDELIYIHGKTKKRVKVKDVYEILVMSGGLLPTRTIHFKTRNPQDVILFADGYEHALRRWISHQELINKGIEIYQILRKINPNIELKRVVPRKYRTTKNAVVERYEGGKWVPEVIRPWWEK